MTDSCWVDSGAPKSSDNVIAALSSFAAGAKVQTLFNTHYHTDQTGNNEVFAAAGAKIIAHQRTREWMSSDYWIPAEERYEKARPKAARPNETFLTTGSIKAGTEQIDYGYLPLAHTNGDIYVYSPDCKCACGWRDVASPMLDPALDYFTGAWIGGRVDAMDTLLKLSNETDQDRSRIRPHHDPSRNSRAERDMMEVDSCAPFQKRFVKATARRTHAGGRRSERPLRERGKDPDSKFLYAAAKGLWAHHDKLDPNVV